MVIIIPYMKTHLLVKTTASCTSEIQMQCENPTAKCHILSGALNMSLIPKQHYCSEQALKSDLFSFFVYVVGYVHRMCSTIKQGVLVACVQCSTRGDSIQLPFFHTEIRKFYSCFLYSFLVGSVVDG